jgi:hypothetical protein
MVLILLGILGALSLLLWALAIAALIIETIKGN